MSEWLHRKATDEFDIWAWRGLQVVTDNASVDAFSAMLTLLVDGWLQIVDEKLSADPYINREERKAFIPRLKSALHAILHERTADAVEKARDYRSLPTSTAPPTIDALPPSDADSGMTQPLAHPLRARA